ncbi:MAG: replication initiator protein A [Clostridia bacterium]|nr:replication initiator protein A [Clostridia bacterium]
MDNNNKYDFYHGDSYIEDFSFYRIPKELFSMEYVFLPGEAKLLYAIMLDRTSLSLKNHWVDEHDNVYIYFTLEDVTRYLGVSPNKATRLLDKLDDKRGFGLIHRKRQGQGKPSRIYVKNIQSAGKEVINICDEYQNPDMSDLVFKNLQFDRS